MLPSQQDTAPLERGPPPPPSHCNFPGRESSKCLPHASGSDSLCSTLPAGFLSTRPHSTPASLAAGSSLPSEQSGSQVGTEPVAQSSGFVGLMRSLCRGLLYPNFETSLAANSSLPGHRHRRRVRVSWLASGLSHGP